MDFAGHCSRRPHSHRHKLTIILNGMDQSISLDSTCFEAQDVSGSKPSDSQGKAKPSRRASVRWRWRWLCRRRGASKVPPRGGVAEVRHCPVPVRCSGWGGVPGSAAPGPVVGRQALVCGAGRRSRRRLGPWEVSWSRRGLLSVPVDAICGSYSGAPSSWWPARGSLVLCAHAVA